VVDKVQERRNSALAQPRLSKVVLANTDGNGRRWLAQTMKKRGTVSQRFKGIENFLVQCVRPVIDILKMHFLDM